MNKVASPHGIRKIFRRACILHLAGPLCSTNCIAHPTISRKLLIGKGFMVPRMTPQYAAVGTQCHFFYSTHWTDCKWKFIIQFRTHKGMCGGTTNRPVRLVWFEANWNGWVARAVRQDFLSDGFKNGTKKCLCPHSCKPVPQLYSWKWKVFIVQRFTKLNLKSPESH